MSTGKDDEGFLSRWSRRKRTEPEDSTLPAEPDPAAPATEAEIADPQTPEEEAAVLEKLGLPDPDTLEKGDDFSVFMSGAVPEVIRRRALRRLWRSNPTLAVLDGLNDYDDDYTSGFVKPGVLKTAYQVGKGLVQKVAEDEGEERPAMDPEATAPPSASSVRAPGEAEPEKAPEVLESMAEETPEGEEGEGLLTEDDAPEEEPVQPTRRRMAFHFKGE